MKFIENTGLPAIYISILKTLTGYRPYSHSVFCLQRIFFFVCSASFFLFAAHLFLFAAHLFCLQRSFFVCSASFLFAAIVFCLQRSFLCPLWAIVESFYFYMKFSRFIQITTMAHKGHTANKKRSLQTKNDRCKQKRNAANKKETLQIKK